MKNKLISILILLLLTLAFAAPNRLVSADGGAPRTEITATSYNLCDTNSHPDCSTAGTEFIVLPNGKMLIRDWLSIMRFDSADARWNVVCHAYSDTIPPASGKRLNANAYFVCKPDTYEGYWEGIVLTRFTPDGIYSVWSARGYGELEGLVSIAKVDPSDSLNHITIVETGSY